MARQISRREWMERFGSRLGIRSHQPRSLAEQFESSQGQLGAGVFGSVVVGDSPDLAIKREHAAKKADSTLAGVPPLSRAPDLQREVDMQAYLGNELGLMPPLRTVEAGPARADRAVAPDSVDVHIGMENLAPRGYRTLQEVARQEDVDPAYVAKLRAEAFLNSAWAARAGVAMRDTHDRNIMVLPEGTRSEPDGSRVKMVDAGYYEPVRTPMERLQQQADAVAMGYSSIQLDGMGEAFKSLVQDLESRGELRAAKDLVNDALVDLELRREALTDAQLVRNLTATLSMRMAGDVFGSNPQRVGLLNSRSA